MRVVGSSWESLGGSWEALGRILGGLGRVLGGLGESWGALWGSVAPLDANMAEKCGKRAPKSQNPVPTRSFWGFFGALGRPKGAKMGTKGRQGTPTWSPRGAKIDKKRHQKLNSKHAKIVRGSFQNGLLEAWRWSQRSEKKTKKGIEKSKRGSRGKVGVQRPPDGIKIAKRIAPEGYYTF